MSTHDDDDKDPTGMRALLRGLPDPGPMPDDLVARIHASLADLSPSDVEGVDAPASGVVSRATTDAGSDRPPWWVRHGGQAAVAAVVLLGGGALVTSQLGSLGDAASGSADSAAGQSETQSEAREDAGTAASPTSDADLGATVTLGPIVVRQSGRDYTALGLPTQLGSLASVPTTTPLTAEAPGIGPIGTEVGVRSCISALGLPSASAAEVDLAALDGAPAAVVIVTVGGERTAYAVGRDCTTGNPAVLAGPVTLP